MYAALAVKNYGEGKICIHTDRIGAIQTGHRDNPKQFWRHIFEYINGKNPEELIRVGLIISSPNSSADRINSLKPISVDKINVPDLSVGDLSRFDCLYFAGLPNAITTDITLIIESFVRNGGGLIIESPDRGGENINVLTAIDFIYCTSAERPLDTYAYWTVAGSNSYVFYDAVSVAFMTTLKEENFPSGWSILMNDVPTVVTATTATSALTLNLGNRGIFEFGVGFTSAMQNGLVTLETGEESSSSSSSSYSSSSSSSSSWMYSTSSLSISSESSVSSGSTSSSSSNSSVSSNSSGSSSSTSTFYCSWSPSGGSPFYLWNGIASSDDGKRLIACPDSSYSLYLQMSYDYGATWGAVGPVMSNWVGAALKSNGHYLAAVQNYGDIYMSYDYGATWIAKGLNDFWSGVAMSRSGQYLIAWVSSLTKSGNKLYRSSDFGASWSLVYTLTGGNHYSRWSDVAISDNGQYMLACCDYGNGVYLSTNFGQTGSWNVIPSGVNGLPYPGYWISVAMSGNGAKQIVADVHFMYVSSDYGGTWTQRLLMAPNYWSNVVCSSDGNTIVVTDTGGSIYISDDFGINWSLSTIIPGNIDVNNTLTSSSDCSILAVAPNVGGDSQRIYIANCTKL